MLLEEFSGGCDVEADLGHQLGRRIESPFFTQPLQKEQPHPFLIDISREIEEVALDGHKAYTRSFDDYRIPRFSDTPPIEIIFLDNQDPGAPRGCGEMPLPATLAAICNAVYDAIGVRFYTIPMTPARVLTALRDAEG